MLVPSWNLLRSHPAAEDVALDLLVFCEGGSCLELPSECRPMRGTGTAQRLQACFCTLACLPHRAALL